MRAICDYAASNIQRNIYRQERFQFVHINILVPSKNHCSSIVNSGIPYFTLTYKIFIVLTIRLSFMANITTLGPKKFKNFL
ncbi:hypothetical protein TDB9533_00776 [Thalassocella blandensis]|nr:hypothetical protein TDB9533_00776 [Thalassocella blandensis]